ncbi:PREDICTED: uncharacterized protein LOC106742709 [Dinoponera quadriceps]|uniref:Uncharacterized protein LOC106742709 n=1 Tax=Dinoponera quadriceps TaxID=609295 RepID=A0A6P3WZ94_DINQU|nr:PREDICTED: uncharacterized protein LOC106742709 [Dinoponera quadriceps]
METFVLLPFFLLSRVPTDVDTWRHGPEYTFVMDANMTTLQGRSILDFYVYQVYSTLKCRPRDFETLHCQFCAANITIYRDPIEVHEDEDSWLHAPFDIKFDQRGIRNLVILREMDAWYLDMVRAFVSQMNFGVDLRLDGAFTTMENTYIGQCESLVNISHIAEGNEVPGREDYEIVPMVSGNIRLKKKHGETLVIEKTRNLENCIDKRDYVITGDTRRHMETQMVSSRSRIEISDMEYDSYTENMVNVIHMGMIFPFHEKISMNLISVRPAEEILQPFSTDAATVSPYVYSEKD